MAGVISASMPIYELHDEASGRSAYSNLNEGLGKVLRMGAYSPEVVDRLHWMKQVLAPISGRHLRPFRTVRRALVAGSVDPDGRRGPQQEPGRVVDLRPRNGCHIAESGHPNADVADVFRFMNGNEHFVLNIVMPAAKVAADTARTSPARPWWWRWPATAPTSGSRSAAPGIAGTPLRPTRRQGVLFSGFTDDDVNPDIGDSTIMETYGIGGFAMACAPAIVRFVGGSAAWPMRRRRRCMRSP